MPIECGIELKQVTEEEFHEVDYRVMRIAFDVHNELGRFCSEKAYQNRFAMLCKSNSFLSVFTEVPITVTHLTFSKHYFVDLIVNGALIYEFKSNSSLSNVDTMQVLNYILLTGTNHGKVINFGSQSVESRFVSTKLNYEKRTSLVIDDDNWKETDEESERIKKYTLSILHDWGAFLDLQLYRDALTFFSGGKENVLKYVDLYCDNRRIGSETFHMLNNSVIFSLSGVTRAKHYFRDHLIKLINHTRLHAIQWINLNHNTIEFETIINENT